MKRRRTAIYALAAIAILPIGPVFGQETAAKKILLSAGLESGGTYHMEKFTKSTMASGKQDHTTTENYTIHVLPAGDGGKEKLARSRVDRVRIETNATADGSRISYDTADRKKQHPDLTDMAKGLLSVTTGAVYTQDNEFKAFEGAAPEESTQAMMRALTNQGFPEKPVGPGDTWNHKIETTMGQMGTVKYDLDYKFKQMVSHNGANCALLTISGSMSTIPGAGANEGFDLKSRSLRGVMYFDPQLRAARKYEINAQLDLTAHGRKMPGTMTTRTVLTKYIPGVR